eukprot:CAMPEP_0118924632 /NCGR_PEP_ID=MMETSP1169-20130426/2681_1 /TAXON_ID=36882 /ORGANISM="Pyramimonas obovata, Strain CCMP722" /LENGTH=267 /DNA_ID=CAMNT_0006865763 /DNA_START=123 /DNA_END=926 /DNA_ORIENTATION=-
MASPEAAGEILVTAWAEGKWLRESSEFPNCSSVDAMYATHLAMQTHPIATSALGGHAGYKTGGVNAIEGQPCLYGPLFGRFVVDHNQESLSKAAINAHQLEPEIIAIMGQDLPSRADGKPYTLEEVLTAVDSFALGIEINGRRATAALASDLPKLSVLSDALNAGGVVLGPRLSPQSLQLDELSQCETEILVNGKSVAKGSTSACPQGGPAHALEWLANHLNSRGLVLQKGMVVATGQTCASKDYFPGDQIVCKFGKLGQVEMVFAP